MRVPQTSTCVSLLLLAGALQCAASTSPLMLRDSGQWRQFDVALDEMAEQEPQGRYTTRPIPALKSVQDLSSRAGHLAKAGQPKALVLYESGRPRNDTTRRILTADLFVHVRPGADIKQISKQVDARLMGSPAYATAFHLLSCDHAGQTLQTVAALAKRPDVIDAGPLLRKRQHKRLVPNDPQFADQWHLLNTGQGSGLAGLDINVTNVWESYTGTGITIGIVDDGLEVSHPDLSPNANTAIDFDYNGNDDDPSPSGADGHGTACAGVAAARGNNALGVSGAAFNASLVGLRLIAAGTSDAQEAAAMAHSNDLIEISSNSWGPFDDGVTLEGPGPLTIASFQNGVMNGRSGSGTIYLWAGGNGGDDDHSNKDGYANRIETISVTAVGNTGTRAFYGERGANHVITSPSNGGTLGITTTDLSGAYRSDFGGTSSATPLAAGVCALMLEANPVLGWRDVQEILIRSATKIDVTHADWTNNAVGFHFNHEYGAGLINAGAAVALANTWVNLPAPQQHVDASESGLALLIPDNAPGGITRNFDLSAQSGLRVEHVTLTVDIEHASRGQLAVTLTSPSGTRSRLIEAHADTSADYADWTFMSVHNWGEDSAGVWTVTIADTQAGTVGTLDDIELTVFGATAIAPTEAPVITSPLTAFGNVESSFQYRITASNFPSLFCATNLPPGLMLQSNSGVISGTPLAEGSNVVSVCASNAIGVGMADISIVIGPRLPRPPVITSPVVAVGLLGEAFSFQITATEGPTNFNAAPLPAGLGIDMDTGVISGTPQSTGTVVVTVSAQNADGTGQGTLTTTVFAPGGTPLNEALDNQDIVIFSSGDGDWTSQTADTSDGVDAAVSAAITHNQESCIETIMIGPGTLSFQWSVSSEADYDGLVLEINGVTVRAISGEVDWTPVRSRLEEGINTIKWCYVKDESVSTGDDRGLLDQVAYLAASDITMGEALDHTAHSFVDGGDAPWTPQSFDSHDGMDTASSGIISDNQTTDVKTTVGGPGLISFFWRVSSEPGFDFLSFYIDDALVTNISGDVDWQMRSFEVPSGRSHNLKWAYEKDEFVAEGTDAGWLDQVVYVTSGTPPGFHTWIQQIFAEDDRIPTGIGGAAGDPDGDRISNLGEYALNLDPLTLSTANVPRAFMDGNEWVYQFLSDTSKVDITYQLQSTTNIIADDWIPASTSPQGTQGNIQSNEHRHVLTESLLMRLFITLPSP